MAESEVSKAPDFLVTKSGDALSNPMSNRLSEQSSEQLYDAACTYTAAHYKSRLDCDLTVFFPTILTRVSEGKITGVCGIREAGTEALFLEQYLTKPVEAHLPGVNRSEIIELGGFSADNRLEAFLLMQSTAPALLEMGYKTVVCTANRPIRVCLKRLGIEFQQLAFADSSMLRDPKDHWGRYYETSPLVLAGDICAGVSAIHGLLQAA